MRTQQAFRSFLMTLNMWVSSKRSSSLNYQWKVVSNLRVVSSMLMEKYLKQSRQAPSLMFWVLLELNIIFRYLQNITNYLCMKSTFYSSGGKACPNHARTASTWVDAEERNYLASLNYQLNEISDSETEKHFYKTKLSQQFRSHQGELEEAFGIISGKNSQLISLQEQLDYFHKDLRSAADDYIALQRKSEAEIEALTNQMNNNKALYEQKLKKMEEQLEQKCQLKTRKRVQEVQNQCADRVKLLQGQIELLTENSKTLSHELSMLQEDYRQMLIKNDTILQESIQRELRKRDFEAQNNYLRDLAQYQAIKEERNHLRSMLTEQDSVNKASTEEKKRLLAKIQVESQRVKDLEEALEFEKSKERVDLMQKYPDLCEAETNTDKQFVPIAMPIDLNLMSEVVSLREFLVQKIVTRFIDFYERAAGTEKKVSKSLLTFNNCLSEMKRDCADLKIILFLHGSLQKIIQVYCPSLNNYSREYLTVKDEFLRKTLIECQTISNPSQRLFRLLDLIFRLKNPLNHLKAELSPGELKLLEMKMLICLKKNFV